MLVKECGYDGTEDRMVRDAIVLMSHHSAVSEKWVDKYNDLFLEMAVNLVSKSRDLTGKHESDRR